MAWELQQHMHQYVAPSIAYYARYRTECSATWLANRYADQRWDSDGPVEDYQRLTVEASSLAWDVLVDAIADKAIEYSTTTNGGFEVYLDGWYSVPWYIEDND